MIVCVWQLSGSVKIVERKFGECDVVLYEHEKSRGRLMVRYEIQHFDFADGSRIWWCV